MRRLVIAALSAAAFALVLVACSPQQRSSPFAPGIIQRSARSAAGSGPQAVDFPPRNEPFDFRTQLEAKYRDQMHRSPTQTYVDLEGDIVWTTEYLRYRVNQCDHQTAVSDVMAEITGQAGPPVCGSAPAGQVNFPPRNEPFDFRQQLDAEYRNVLHRGAVSTYVDTEGDIVWTSEYLRYRLNGCDHQTAVTKVFMQIDGQGIQPVCAMNPSPPPPPPPPPTPALSPSFTITSTTGAGANNCRIDPTGDSTNPALIKCIFDASSSTPATLISGYEFVLVNTGKTLGKAVKLSEPTTSCGFPYSSTVTIQLTITSSDGKTATTTQKATFTKPSNGPC